MDAITRWTEQLQAWALPAAILDAAPRNPYELPTSIMRRPVVDPLTSPTGEAVLARLGPGERLLDVGCGAGRISGAFTAEHDVVGVEPRASLAAEARRAGLTVHEGRWPQSASAVGRAEVVLCTHVLYDVPEPAPFLAALHRAAERRVVLEITAAHPWTALAPLYRRYHDLDRPAGPTAEELVAVVTQVLEVRPTVRRWSRPGSTYDTVRALADQTARMLCLPPTEEILGDIGAHVAEQGTVLPDGRIRTPDADLATIWWDTDEDG